MGCKTVAVNLIMDELAHSQSVIQNMGKQWWPYAGADAADVYKYKYNSKLNNENEVYLFWSLTAFNTKLLLS